MSTRTDHDGADEQTWYAVIVDERYCLDSLNVDDALAEARRIAAANPRLSCRLVSFPVPRGRDPETTAYRLGVTDPNWGALWKNEPTQPRTATAPREPDATAPPSQRNGPWLLVGAAALIAAGVAAFTFVGSSHRPSPSQPSTPSLSVTKVPTATAPDATTATATATTATSRETATATATPHSTPPATSSADATSEATTPSATNTTAPSPSSEGQSR